ncbi:hypothetical protein D3C80_1773970 [compost metagenome]
MLIDKLGAACKNIDLGIFQAFSIKALKAGNFFVLGFDQLLPVKARFANFPAIANSVFKMLGKLRSVDKELLGNTTTDNACSTHAIFFGQTNLLAHGTGQTPCPDTAGTTADNKKIIIVVGHGALHSKSTLRFM